MESEPEKKQASSALFRNSLQADSGINPVKSPVNYWIDWGGGKGTIVERMERRVDRRPSYQQTSEFSVAGPP
jgi:hypothetical protein